MRKYFLCLVMIFLHVSAEATLYGQLSSLEKQIVDEGLSTFGLSPMDEPEGKVVKSVYIFTAPPFGSDSAWLTALNRLQLSSKEEVIRQDIFQQEGEVYDEALLRDSEILLRKRDLVRSLAVIVPVTVKGELGQELHLLVVTRDLLGLQPKFSLNGYGSFGDFVLTNLSMSVGEHNLWGYNKSLSLSYEMQQGGHIVSSRYFDPRLFASSLEFLVKPALIFARDSFKFEGLVGNLKLEKPLLSRMQRWGYGIDLNYGSKPVMDFNGSKVRSYEIEGRHGREKIENQYHLRYAQNALFGKYSRGTTYKKELFFSYNLDFKRPSLIGEQALSEEQKDAIRQKILPRDELESYVTLGFNYFQNQFLSLYDYDNFRLEELKRTGPIISIGNDFAVKSLLGSDHDFLRPKAKISYVQPFNRDSFGSLTVSTSNRFDGQFNDNIYKLGISLVSPQVFGFGRAIFEGRLSTIFKGRDNQKFVLGSEAGIRGVESGRYSGSKGLRANWEIRTVPLDLWIVHVGLVAFYDIGSAFDDWRKANPTHAIGFGLRILAPQLSSLPLRIDLGFPLSGIGEKEHIVVPSFGTGQAF